MPLYSRSQTHNILSFPNPSVGMPLYSHSQAPSYSHSQAPAWECVMILIVNGLWVAKQGLGNQKLAKDSEPDEINKDAISRDK